MNSFRHFPLGARLPESPHAVISSLPTMADVRGYEEKEPRVIDALKSGYPRFVVHEFIQRLIAFYTEREGLWDVSVVLIPGRRATDDALSWLGAGFEKLEVHASVFLVFCKATDVTRSHDLRKYVQHTGCGISSRQAEDLLVEYGLIDACFEEATYKGNAETKVGQDLAGLIGCREADVLACASGMNAFYAGFRAVQELNQSRGRTAWVQLGWLYLDSGKILEQFLGEGETLECIYDVTDTDALVDRIQACGESLACVVIECPTNPLVQVADLPRIAAAVRSCGGMLLVDPTIASVYNVNVLPYADILVTSLTKYASCEGDVMIGALALNPQSPHYGDLVLRSSSFYQPPYVRDLARLACELQRAPEVVSRINANAHQLAVYLRAHPAVKKVHYAGDSDHFAKVAKPAGSGGAMITVELHGAMEPIYDALDVMKGPSFGAEFTLACPFMYLAHYDLVCAAEGRAFLESIGIDADLIRISVGTEPIEAIVECFEKAFHSKE